MDAARYSRIKKALLEAMECPSEQLQQVLDRACDGDAALRAEVEALLAEEIGTGFLEQGPLRLASALEEEDLVGRKLGRIRIKRLIAHGGMGMVYEGIDELLQRPVAVKVIRGDWQLSEQRRAALLDEARLLSGIGHPNICELHDFFVDGDRDVLVMELLDGTTLRKWLEQGRPGADPIEIAIQITDALASAHERGIAHLDLKPENVMLTAAGQVKVLDFGVARNIEQVSRDPTPDRGGTSAAAGTPGYVAPEQVRGEASTASDLWSFGIVLLELLTGRRPSVDVTGPPASNSDDASPRIALPGGLPRAESALLKRLLDDRPGERPSAREARQALGRIQGRPGRRLAWGLAASLMAVLAFTGYRYTTDLQFERNQAVSARAEAEELAGFMLEDLYNGLVSVGRLELLEPVALKAVDYYGDLGAGAVDSGRGDAALALMRAAEVLELQGHQDASIDAFQRSNHALEKLSQQRPEDDLVRYRLGLSRVSLGVALRYAGDQDKAANVSAAAVEIGRELASETEPASTGDADRSEATGAPSRGERLALLISALFQRADGLVRTGRPEAAIPLLDEAESLAAGERTRHPAVARNLGDIRWLRCMVYYDQRRGADVVDACNASLTFDRERYLQSPDEIDRLAFYFDANWQLANAYRLTGQHEQALATADYAEMLARRLVARDTERVQSQNRLAVILVTKGFSQRALGREEQMRASFEAVLEITEPMMADAELVIVNNRLTALAMLGRLEEAQPLARQMRDGGWRRPEFLALCREFDLLDECSAPTQP